MNRRGCSSTATLLVFVTVGETFNSCAIKDLATEPAAHVLKAHIDLVMDSAIHCTPADLLDRR